MLNFIVMNAFKVNNKDARLKSVYVKISLYYAKKLSYITALS